jgi:hypothetical protein
MFNIYGDEGEKFIVGGLFVRKAQNWIVCGRSISED